MIILLKEVNWDLRFILSIVLIEYRDWGGGGGWGGNLDNCVFVVIFGIILVVRI